MFGDMGHGTVFFLFSLYLLTLKRNISNPGILDGVYKYRYLFLMMSFFSMFSGFLYNDFMSIPLNLFGSCYE